MVISEIKILLLKSKNCLRIRQFKKNGTFGN